MTSEIGRVYLHRLARIDQPVNCRRWLYKAFGSLEVIYRWLPNEPRLAIFPQTFRPSMIAVLIVNAD
jgi:hypothetical protein